MAIWDYANNKKVIGNFEKNRQLLDRLTDRETDWMTNAGRQTGRQVELYPDIGAEKEKVWKLERKE